MDKIEIINDIKKFLDGSNDYLKYIVNVETNPNNNIAYCVIHEPNKPTRIEGIEYEPFMYMKDLSLNGIELYADCSDFEKESVRDKYGIKITKLNTGNQDRLINGFCYKLTSTISYNSIVSYLRNGGIHPYSKLRDDGGNVIYDKRDRPIQPNRHLFYNVRTTEQFFISKRTRLYKGIEEYKDVHRVTFDIETTGLRYEITRIFAIGVRDNRGFEKIIEVEKTNDDASEIKLIKDFFETIINIKPAILCGYNSEFFDFEFILGRARLLNLDIDTITTTLRAKGKIYRRRNSSLKYGSKTEKFTATEMWGISVVDIIHAVKKVAEINSDILNNKLEYIAEFEGIAKSNRTYIDGEGNNIGNFYHKNDIFLCDETNKYIQIPNQHQIISRELYELQLNKDSFSDVEYKNNVRLLYAKNQNFVSWLRENALPKKMMTYIAGKDLVRQYLLDDLWETEQVDELYNQSTFMLSKIIPTTFQRISTMGTAAIWNLLLTAWSYDNDLAIPESDTHERFSGGLARTFIVGFVRKGRKFDFASLYPYIQLTYGVFPIFDITNVMEKVLLYMTTTRNIYKKLAGYDSLNDEEVELLNEIDHEVYIKYINNTLTHEDRHKFKVKQSPFKILNNSLFGALGSNVAFKWSDNVSAGKITCIGRVQLRHAIYWFNVFGCTPLLAVTDGINFQIPDKTKIRVSDDIVVEEMEEGLIEDMWKYGDKVGIDALITKFNTEELEGYMSIDDDGSFESCLNLSKINYATYSKVIDKKTGELKDRIKLTGNTIKSKVMSGYIKEFIDDGFDLILKGKGKEFVEYYYQYIDLIKEMKIPIIKIASKRRYLESVDAYINRGVDKNGRPKAKKAHMELIIQERRKIARELFEKHKNELDLSGYNDKITDMDKLRLVDVYMPPEPELDSIVYYYNIGTKLSHGDSKTVMNENGEEELLSRLIDINELMKNPNLTADFNYHKYISVLNKRIKPLLTGFKKEIREKIIVKINRKNELVKREFKDEDLILTNYEHNNLDDTMHLEDMEVDFWNKTGYDPRLIWGGFKLDNKYTIMYDIYDNALEYVNKKTSIGNIKSVNDKLMKDDHVLIKNDKTYHIGMYNGTYIQIIEHDVDIPRTNLDDDYDTMILNRMDNHTDKELISKIRNENNNFAKMKFCERIFPDFVIKYELDKINPNITLDILLQVNESKEAFNTFYLDKISEITKENIDEYDDEMLVDVSYL